MENSLIKGKTNTKNSDLLNAFIFQSLLLALVAIFALGCEEEMLQKKPATETPVIGADVLRSEATQIIQSSLTNNDPMVRANAIEVVAATGLVKMMPRVQRLLNDQVVPVRFTAALAVGDSQYSLAQKSVAQLLKDEDENVRIAAAYAVGKLGHKKYYEVLRKAILRSDLKVRANAALLLGKSGDENALKLLYWALQNKDSDDRVRFNAIQAIATLGDDRIFSKLWAMRISAYADDRVLAIQTLGALGTQKAKSVLITMLDDDILEVRLAAAEQLGALGERIGEATVLDVFEKNLTAGLDKQDLASINMRTALAIGRIRTDALKQFLPRLLKNQSPIIRLAAAKAVLQYSKAK